jgi:hypothetical protein
VLVQGSNDHGAVSQPQTLLLQRADDGVDHPTRQEVDGGFAAELVARAALDQPRAEAAL